jgi:hypothetical protein
MGSHHIAEIKEDRFAASSRLQQIVWAMVAVGLVTVVAGIALDGHRFWANYLLNNWFFLGLSLAGVLFVAIQSVSNAAWSLGFRRIAEAMGAYLPWALGGFGILMVATAMHWNHLYHWAHHGIAEEFLPSGQANPEFDPIIAAKTPYLNIPFMAARTVVFYALWILLYRAIRRHSLLEDQEGGLLRIRRIKTLASVFLPTFAVTWAMSTWDYVMSVDTHWYSTIFWVYHFASAWVAALSFMAIVAVLLKKAGHLPHMNENHLHDIGKFMFAFSIFWAYIWVSQFLLIYYANIPEETIYFQERLEHFKIPFFVNVAVNFVLPFFLLMTRGSKRQGNYLMGVGLILIGGKYLDLYLGVMPGTVGGHAHFGWMEIGMFVGYLGLFLLVVTRAMASASLLPYRHPYIKEYATHEVM